MRRTAIYLALFPACIVWPQDRSEATGLGIGARLTLVDAAKYAIQYHPQLESQREQIRIAQAQKIAMSSQFDSVLNFGTSQSAINAPIASAQSLVGNLFSDSLDSQVQVLRKMRSGISISPIVNLSRFSDSGQNTFGVNNARLGMQATIPLLRGKGAHVVAANERAAASDADAAALATRNSIAATVANVALSYWVYVAAKESYAAAVASEERGHLLVDNAEALIEGGQLPRAELNNAKANLADRTASRIASEARRLETQQQLAFSAGFGSSEIAQQFEAVDAFPEVSENIIGAAELADSQALAASAVANRLDLSAAKAALRGEEERQVAARDAFRPTLNLTVGAYQNSFMQGLRPDRWVLSPFSSRQGFSFVSGLSYSFPSRNRIGESQALRSSALVKQAELKIEDLRRGVISDVRIAVNNLRASGMRVLRAQESARAFQQALDNEREKLRAGLGSVNQLLLVEDRLNTSLLNLVQARLAYAVSITQYRLAAGMLVPPGNSAPEINRNLFFEVPAELVGSSNRQVNQGNQK